MPNFSAELCKLLCRSFSSTPVNFGNFSAVIFAVFYSSVFQAFAKIKKRDASLCPERRVPKPEGTRPYSRRDTSFCPNPRVDFIKSSCGFCQILTRIFTSPREVLINTPYPCWHNPYYFWYPCVTTIFLINPCIYSILFRIFAAQCLMIVLSVDIYRWAGTT